VDLKDAPNDPGADPEHVAETMARLTPERAKEIALKFFADINTVLCGVKDCSNGCDNTAIYIAMRIMAEWLEVNGRQHGVDPSWRFTTMRAAGALAPWLDEPQ
jgi:hypothetical protein